MKTESINKYVSIGSTIRYLQDCTVNFIVFLPNGVIDNIQRFFDCLEELEMHVTLRYSEKLKEFQEKIELERDSNRKLTDSEARELCQIMNSIRDVFQAEGRGMFAFITTEKRYDTEKLLKNIEKIFSVESFEKLPQIAKFDFEEAGKCIAFERSTAAAFHLLRGTEDVLKLYYKKFLRSDPGNKNWGGMIIALKAKTKGKLPDLITLNHLDNIRVGFRNPTQHPDKTYDIQEVQDLLGVCIDVINRMIKEIK